MVVPGRAVLFERNRHVPQLGPALLAVPGRPPGKSLRAINYSTRQLRNISNIEPFSPHTRNAGLFSILLQSIKSNVKTRSQLIFCPLIADLSDRRPDQFTVTPLERAPALAGPKGAAPQVLGQIEAVIAPIRADHVNHCTPSFNFSQKHKNALSVEYQKFLPCFRKIICGDSIST